MKSVAPRESVLAYRFFARLIVRAIRNS